MTTRTSFRIRRLALLLALFGTPLSLAVVAAVERDWPAGTFWLLLLIVNLIAPWTPKWMTEREGDQ